jgi:isoaspartyl peptidase/L-asparaginase-like protein (Ntn-hydrolase superfamily)
MIHDELGHLGGDGGIVAVDAHGTLAMPFNSEGMYRAWIQHSGNAHTAIFTDDHRVHDAP